MDEGIEPNWLAVPPLSGSGAALALPTGDNMMAQLLSLAVGAGPFDGITCGIVVGRLKTYFTIMRKGVVVDTACQDLGWGSIAYSAARTVTAISDGGETFLDAVAKRIGVGDTLHEDMPWILGQLIAETMINLVSRKKPPQVSQRLLSTEPLWRHWPVDQVVVAAPSVAALQAGVRPPATDAFEQDAAQGTNILAPVVRGLDGSLKERGLQARWVPEPPEPQEVLAYSASPLCAPFVRAPDSREPAGFADAPIFNAADKLINEGGVGLQIDEFTRRHCLRRGAPLLVALSHGAETERVWRQLPSGSVVLLQAAPLNGFVSATMHDDGQVRGQLKELTRRK